MKKLVFCLLIFSCRPSNEEIKNDSGSELKETLNVKMSNDSAIKANQEKALEHKIMEESRKKNLLNSLKPKHLKKVDNIIDKVLWNVGDLLLDENMICYRILSIENCGDKKITTVSVRYLTESENKNIKVSIGKGEFKKIKVCGKGEKDCVYLSLEAIRYDDGTFSETQILMAN